MLVCAKTTVYFVVLKYGQTPLGIVSWLIYSTLCLQIRKTVLKIMTETVRQIMFESIFTIPILSRQHVGSG